MHCSNASSREAASARANVAEMELLYSFPPRISVHTPASDDFGLRGVRVGFGPHRFADDGRVAKLRRRRADAPPACARGVAAGAPRDVGASGRAGVTGVVTVKGT